MTEQEGAWLDRRSFIKDLAMVCAASKIAAGPAIALEGDIYVSFE